MRVYVFVKEMGATIRQEGQLIDWGFVVFNRQLNNRHRACRYVGLENTYKYISLEPFWLCSKDEK